MTISAGKLDRLKDRNIASHKWMYIAALVVTAYLGSSLLALRFPPAMSMFVVQPLLWLLPIIAIWGWSHSSLQRARTAFGEIDEFGVLAAVIALAQIGLMLLAGTLFGFGNSPYSHGLSSLLGNLWFIGVILVAREVSRSYITRHLSRRGELAAILGTWFLFWVTSLPFAGFSLLSSPETAFPHIGSVLLPSAAAQLFATYIVFRSGALASTCYLGILAAFEWFSPMLPNLPWTVMAILGVLVPVFGISLLETDDVEIADSEGESGISRSWVLAAVLVLMVWFNLGIFGVQPSIVHGVSMEPNMFTGDVVITGDVNTDDLDIGDVVRFQQNGLVVLHRIVDIQVEDGERVFIAQGDNNPAPDGPVAADDIDGKLLIRLPKVGLPAIYLKYVVGRIVG